jgi:hypothetical protein
MSTAGHGGASEEAQPKLKRSTGLLEHAGPAVPAPASTDGARVATRA